MEVIPPLFLSLDAWSFIRIGSGDEAKDKTPFLHKWAVMFLIAVGFAVFAVRYCTPAAQWSDKLMRTSFWSLNIGLAWMVFVSLFPLGVLQLYQSVDGGNWSARTMSFNFSGLNHLLEWLRPPGDGVFIDGGTLPLLWMAVLAARHRGKRQDVVTDEDPRLFTEASDPLG